MEPTTNLDSFAQSVDQLLSSQKPTDGEPIPLPPPSARRRHLIAVSVAHTAINRLVSRLGCHAGWIVHFAAIKHMIDRCQQLPSGRHRCLLLVLPVLNPVTEPAQVLVANRMNRRMDCLNQYPPHLSRPILRDRLSGSPRRRW